MNGFREVEHTADWQLDVWGESLAALFEQAALGMDALSGAVYSDVVGEEMLVLEAPDAESLLVAFLSELLYWEAERGLAGVAFSLEVAAFRLVARVRVARLLRREKEIKAVTFHNLAVTQAEDGLWRASIVLDV